VDLKATTLATPSTPPRGQPHTGFYLFLGRHVVKPDAGRIPREDGESVAGAQKRSREKVMGMAEKQAQEEAAAKAAAEEAERAKVEARDAAISRRLAERKAKHEGAVDMDALALWRKGLGSSRGVVLHRK
jgi:hypothetical protein